MADVNEKLSFKTMNDNYGILATDTLVEDDVDNFLNDTPADDIKKVKTEEKKVEEKKTPAKKEEKEVEEKRVNNQLSEDELDNVFDKDGEDDTEDEDDDSKGEEKKISKKKEEKKAEEENDNKEEVEESSFKTISKELVGLGVFKLGEDESEDDLPETPEDFAERFAYEKKTDVINMIDSFLGKFGDDYKEMFENVFVKGISPEDYLQRYVKINSIKDIDITQPDNWERVVRENLKREGYPAASIEKRLEQYKQYGDLEDEAKLAQTILLKKEEEDLQVATQRKEADLRRKAEAKNEFNNTVTKVLNEKLKEKEFDGIPVDVKIANTTAAYLTKGKYQAKNGDVLTEFEKDILDLDKPENHAQKIKVALLLQTLKDDPKLTKIQSRAVTKESNKLFSKLVKEDKKKSNNKEGGKSSIKNKDEGATSWF